MLSVLLCWIFALIVFGSFGYMFVDIYTRVVGKVQSYSLADTFFIGICVVGTLVGITSIWLPSDVKILLVLTVLSIAYILFFKRQAFVLSVRSFCENLDRTDFLMTGLALVIFLIYIAVPLQWPDSFYYHIQNVMWNEQYHVIPGLANLQERFGFNSNFLLLSSVFGIRPIVGEFIFGINSLSALVVLWHIIINRRKNKIYVNILFLFAYVLFFMIYRIHIPSLSTDLLPNLFVFYLLISLVSNKNNIQDKSLLFWLIPIFCVTLKVSMIFICLTALYVLISFIRNKNYRATWFIVVFSALIVVTWLARNIIITGYILYPYPSLDVFSVDWKLPLEYVIESKKYIQAYAISMNAMFISSDYVLALPLTTKLKEWILDQTPMEILFTVLTVIAPVMMFSVRKKIKNNKKEYGSLFFLWAIAFIAILFWLFMAPAIRFTVGFMLILFFVPAYIFLDSKENIRIKLNIQQFILWFAIAFIGVVVIRYFKSAKSPNYFYAQMLVRPQGLVFITESDPLKVRFERVNNVVIAYPINWGCLDYPLPCSRDFTKNIELRGNSFQDGFRDKKNIQN